VEWKPEEKVVRDEHKEQGYSGRFGAGLPRINDGSLLFLQHMISKRKPVDNGGSRIAIVFNGSPLFTGDAASGESEIRRWIIENDWLEAVVALPDQLFYNTGIFTYVWIVTNRKTPERQGKIQLVNAVSFHQDMRKSLGNKRHEIGDGRDGKPDHIKQITALYCDFEEGPHSRIFSNAAFGYRKVTIEQPLRLRFAVTPEALDTLRATTAYQNLARSKKKDGAAAQAEVAAGRQQQLALLGLLEALPVGQV
jgi:type I restriction enzyme M protein